jgi:hypothetical protein
MARLDRAICKCVMALSDGPVKPGHDVVITSQPFGRLVLHNPVRVRFTTRRVFVIYPIDAQARNSTNAVIAMVACAAIVGPVTRGAYLADNTANIPNISATPNSTAAAAPNDPTPIASPRRGPRSAIANTTNPAVPTAPWMSATTGRRRPRKYCNARVTPSTTAAVSVNAAARIIPEHPECGDGRYHR